MLAALVPTTMPVLDPPHVSWLDALLRLGIACALGAVIGLERQIHGRAAGLRTMMLVAVGCSLIMLTSNYFVEVYFAYGDMETGNLTLRLDPARLAYGVMSGIGFLGAGAIIKSGLTIRGLTTAATIWCVAAIGLAVGIGLYFHSLVTTGLVLFALFVLDRVERALESHWYKIVEVIMADEPGIVQRFAEKVEGRLAHVQDIDIERRGDGTLKAIYSIRLPDREAVLPFFDAIAREPEVRYLFLRRLETPSR